MEMTALVPKGFEKLAESPMRYVTATAYFKRETQEVYITVENDEGSKAMGPFTKGEIESIIHVADDVKFLLRGRW